MPHSRPEAGCHEIVLDAGCALAEGAEVALEDYARALFRAGAAEAVRAAGDPAKVGSVHLCAPQAPITAALRRDLEDFARSLVVGTGGGLGWS